MTSYQEIDAAATIAKIEAALDLVTTDDIDTAIAAATSQSVWIRPSDFEVVSGSPTVELINSCPVVAFDAGDTEVVSTTFMPPSHWDSFDVHAWWTVPSGSGNVEWRIQLRGLFDGDVISGNATSDVLAAAPAAVDVLRTELASAVDNSDAFHQATFRRRGGDATDTLNADAYLIALEVSRAS
ncbi:MAG: hypothetical protein AAGG08_10765 [Actinomycetota bacterium]